MHDRKNDQLSALYRLDAWCYQTCGRGNGTRERGTGREKCGEGPHVEMWPRAPNNLKTALIVV